MSAHGGNGDERLVAARHREIRPRDPDGYVVVLAGAAGDL